MDADIGRMAVPGECVWPENSFVDFGKVLLGNTVIIYSGWGSTEANRKAVEIRLPKRLENRHLKRLFGLFLALFSSFVGLKLSSNFAPCKMKRADIKINY